MKLTRKFTLGLVVGVLIVQVGFGFVRVEREQDLFQLDINREEIVLGRSLQLAAETVARTNGQPAARALVEHANLRDAHVSVRWVELDPEGPAHLQPRAPLADLAALARGEQVNVVLGEEDPAYFTYTPVALPDHPLGAIEISDSLHDETAYMRQSVINAALSTLVLVLLCGGVAWLVGALFIGRPVRALVGQARRVGAGDLSGRISLTQRDELGELAAEMNDMCGALDQARSQATSEAEAKIAALEQLKHVDRLRTVGTLASGIAHELGTPLNVVEGHAQLIGEASVSDEVSDSARVIVRQARRMANIIRQLLDFARREQRTSGSAEVVAVVRRVFELAEPIAKKRGVVLEVEDTAGALSADISVEELTQVLLNIVVNGVQAMPDGGQLTVAVDALRATSPSIPGDEREMIRIVVTDVGEGMSAEMLPRVFEPFFTTKDVGAGTGLGLSVAYGIVVERDGWIDVASREGEGSRFSIFVPQEAS